MSLAHAAAEKNINTAADADVTNTEQPGMIPGCSAVRISRKSALISHCPLWLPLRFFYHFIFALIACYFYLALAFRNSQNTFAFLASVIAVCFSVAPYLYRMICCIL